MKEIINLLLVEKMYRKYVKLFGNVSLQCEFHSSDKHLNITSCEHFLVQLLDRFIVYNYTMKTASFPMAYAYMKL